LGIFIYSELTWTSQLENSGKNVASGQARNQGRAGG